MLLGAPSILQFINVREFANKVVSSLKEYCPTLKIVHGKPCHSQSQESVKGANQDIENMLSWMQDEKTDCWSKGIPFVQLMKNRAFHSGIQRTPYEALFGCKVKLSQNAQLGKSISTLSLPDFEEDVKAGTKCSIAGWGTTRYNGSMVDKLREVTVTVIDRDDCNGPNYYEKIEITRNMLCAGNPNGGKDACQCKAGEWQQESEEQGEAQCGTLSGGSNGSRYPSPVKSCLCPLEGCFLWLLDAIWGDCLKIVGGKEAAPHSKPYMAYLSIGCGAALIKEDWLLTAAHCFTLGEVAVLGAHSIIKDEKQQLIEVEEVFMYPKYNCLSKQNDLMLLKLGKPATLNKNVRLLSLPSSGDDVSPGTRCNVAGWGTTSFMGNMSDTLREVNVTVIDRKLCNTLSYYNGFISKSMLCAGDKIGGKDSCGVFMQNRANKVYASDVYSLHGCRTPGLEGRSGCRKKKNIEVTLGAHSLIENEAMKQTFQVKTVVVHPDYNSSTLLNDLMLLELGRPAELNQYVSLLDLPNSGEDVRPGTKCTVAGWGKISFNGQTSNTLQEVSVTVIDRELCSNFKYYKGRITKNMLCAGDEKGGKDSCRLSKKAVLNKFVSLLHLPAAARSPPGGTQCSIAGWGIMGYNGQLADKLQEINVAVIDRDICSGPDYLNKPIKSSMICAGHPNKKKAFCQGDYGGPLICDGTYTAIASYGFKCGENSKPGVYTLLTDNYLKWIKETIQKY
ncbi:GRAA protein, partial [Polypterus senegalus]